ncbi:microtubule-associated protein 4 isoform X3 [Takifugu flavidus]|uniref:microtubule-associated protein 4 isoform X3 n=1 Tax=Takifugu flavidus TaxID=433684 RepID=UPI0025440961|nr:microtubule-associated protein 4 isoform X3 [Takifugu flavidus]
MAELDLSLSDALTDGVPPPGPESLVQQDFVAQLESEAFDDQVGEIVIKMDYIPLLENDDTKADLDNSLENGEQESHGVQKPGALGSFWPAHAACLPSDLQFTSDVSTLISCPAGNLEDSLDDRIDSQPGHERSAYPGGDEREGECVDRKQKKKKKRRQKTEESFENSGSSGHFEVQTQGENTSSTEDIYHRIGPSRDRQAGWEDQIGKCGGRGKRGKSRKKIPEEWGMTAEPLVPTSAVASQIKEEVLLDLGRAAESPFADSNQSPWIQEAYVEEDLLPKPLSKDLFSVTSISPLVLNSALNATAAPFTMPSTTNSATFESMPGNSFPADSFDLLMDSENSGLDQCNVSQEREAKVGDMIDSGMIDSASFTQESCAQGIPEQDAFRPASPSSQGHSPEVLASAPPISPPDTLWVLNDSQLSSSTESSDLSNKKIHAHPLPSGLSFDTPCPAPLRSPKTTAQEFDLKDEKKKKRKSSSPSLKSSTSPGESFTQQAPPVVSPSSQSVPSVAFLGSGLNPSAKPFFPSFANSVEEGTMVQPVDSAVKDMTESSEIKTEKLEVEMKNPSQEFHSVKVEFASCESLANEEKDVEKTWTQSKKESKKEIEAELARGEEKERESEKVPEKEAEMVQEREDDKRQDNEAETLSKTELEKTECVTDEASEKKMDNAEDMEAKAVKDKETEALKEPEIVQEKEAARVDEKDEEMVQVKETEAFKEPEMVPKNFKDMEAEMVKEIQKITKMGAEMVKEVEMVAENFKEKEAETVKEKEAEIVKEDEKIKEKETEMVEEVEKMKAKKTEMFEEVEKMKAKKTERVKEDEKMKEKETEMFEEVEKMKAKKTEKVNEDEKMKEKETEMFEEVEKMKEKETEMVGVTEPVTAELESVKDNEAELIMKSADKEKRSESEKIIKSEKLLDQDAGSKTEERGTDKGKDKEQEGLDEKKDSPNKTGAEQVEAEAEGDLSKKLADTLPLHKDTETKEVDIPVEAAETKAANEEDKSTTKSEKPELEDDAERHVKSPEKRPSPVFPHAETAATRADVRTGVAGGTQKEAVAEKKKGPVKKSGVVVTHAAEKKDSKDKAAKPETADKTKKMKPATDGSRDVASGDRTAKPAVGATKVKAAPKPRLPNTAAGSPVPPRLPTFSSSTTPDRKMTEKDRKSTKAPATAAPGPKRPASTAPPSSRDLRPKPSAEARGPVSKTAAATSAQTAAATKIRTASAAAAKPSSSVRTTLSARSSATSATSATAPAKKTPDNKAAEEKKVSTLRTSAGTETTTATTVRSSAATTIARSSAAKAAAASSSTAPEKKPAVLRSSRTASSTSSSYKAAAQPASATVPDSRSAPAKVGSRESTKHQPGGGKLQVLNKKLDLSKVTSKCGSKDNIKHKPGGGNVKIESHKVSFKEKCRSKVGSVDNVSHPPGGGSIQAEGVQEPTEGNGTPPGGSLAPVSGCEAVPAGTPPTPNSQALTEPPALDSHIPETSI